MEATLTRTLCKHCGAITLVPGFDECDRCMTDVVKFIPIADIADVIMVMDQFGWLPADRREYFKKWKVTPMQLEAAEEEVESRYRAAWRGDMPFVPQRRNRNRRW